MIQPQWLVKIFSLGCYLAIALTKILCYIYLFEAITAKISSSTWHSVIKLTSAHMSDLGPITLKSNRLRLTITFNFMIND